MKHYCRYCSHCFGYDENMGWCDAINKEVKKTSIRNACTDFDFYEIDAFYYNRSDNPEVAKYKPKIRREKQIGEKEKHMKGQMSLFDMVNL